MLLKAMTLCVCVSSLCVCVYFLHYIICSIDCASPLTIDRASPLTNDISNGKATPYIPWAALCVYVSCVLRATVRFCPSESLNVVNHSIAVFLGLLGS